MFAVNDILTTFSFSFQIKRRFTDIEEDKLVTTNDFNKESDEES